MENAGGHTGDEVYREAGEQIFTKRVRVLNGGRRTAASSDERIAASEHGQCESMDGL
jgi:hypothetical protein